MMMAVMNGDVVMMPMSMATACFGLRRDRFGAIGRGLGVCCGLFHLAR